MQFGSCATSEERALLLETRTVVDDLFYLRDAEDDETAAQLAWEAERAGALRSELEASRTRVAAFVERAVPAAVEDESRVYGDWEWRSSLVDGAKVWARRRSGSGEARDRDRWETMLNEAMAPATLPSAFPGGASYRGLVSGVSDVQVAPDGESVAYTVDATGEETYSVEFAPARPPVLDVDGEVAWVGGTLYCLRTDDSGRPFQVWALDERGDETLRFAESDERFRVEAPRVDGSGTSALFRVASRDATEVLRIDGGRVDVLVPRRPGATVDAVDGHSGSLWVVETRDAVSRVLRDGEELRLDGADAYESVRALSSDVGAVSGVADGVSATWIVRGAKATRVVPPDGFEGVALAPGHGGDLTLEVSAPHRFARALRFDADAREWRGQPETTAFEAALRVDRRDAGDVPLVRVAPPGTTKGFVLYAYGAYGARYPLELTGEAAAFLASGLSVVVAAVRGGGERGPPWHAAGRRDTKARSAADVATAARYLAGLREGPVVARGRSAGGLSVGGACCDAPDAFAAVALDVPFLDPVGTLADAALPLTVNEWEEFGNPHEGLAFATLDDLSPLSKASRGVPNFPPCLLRPALRDARTGWWEAFKFAARLRDADADADVTVHADDRGHFGPASGPDHAYDVALPVAFLLDRCGLDAPDVPGDEPTTGDAEPTTGDAEPTTGDAEPTTGDAEPTTGVAEPSTGVAEPSNVDTRPSSAQVAQAADLRTRVFSPHLDSIGSIYLQNKMYEQELQSAACAAVALDDDGGTVVAVASAADVGGAWYVSAVATDPAWRRKGLASRLLDAIDSECDVPLFLHVAAHNEPALNLYRRRGFVDASPDLDPVLKAALDDEVAGSEHEQLLLYHPDFGA